MPKKTGSFYQKQKHLIRVLNCYNVELNIGNPTRSKMELFQTTVNGWKPISFFSWNFL